jgi:hypothetical protein
MPVTATINGVSNSLVHRGSDEISTGTIPDVCKTPTDFPPCPPSELCRYSPSGLFRFLQLELYRSPRFHWYRLFSRRSLQASLAWSPRTVTSCTPPTFSMSFARLSNDAREFILGEEAALVAGEETMASLDVDPLGAGLSVGIATGPKRIKTRTVCPVGWTDGSVSLRTFGAAHRHQSDRHLLRHERRAVSGRRIRVRLGPNTRIVRVGVRFHRPADCWGDGLAPSPPLAIALATIAGEAYANGPYALLWASSEGDERSAALLAGARAGDRGIDNPAARA